MEYIQLKYFCRVVELGNITKASQELHITQPSLSISLKNLENEMGTPLFDRFPGKIQINQAGREFYKECLLILSNWERVKTQIREFGEDSVKSVAIASSADGVLKKCLDEFLLKNTAYSFTTAFLPEDQICERLKHNQFDFAICPDILPHSLVSWEYLYTEEYCFVAEAGHPISEKEEFTVEDIAQYPYIAYLGISDANSFEPFYLNPINRLLKPIVLSNEMEIIRDSISRTPNSFTLMPNLSLMKFRDRKKLLVRKMVDFPYSRTMGLMRLRDCYMKKCVWEVYNFIKDMFNDAEFVP